MVRPALTLLSARAVGGQASDVVLAAVAVQLVHEFTLLHDDIMDDDRLRRHRPAAWVVFGVPAALLAGDALWALALHLMSESKRHPTDGRDIGILISALHRLTAGQAADIDLSQRNRVSASEWQEMAADKTGALMGAACALGALSSGGSSAQIRYLQQVGEHLGVAFQCVDDLLGIWADPNVTGKPVGNDVVRRKRTLPVVAALLSGTTAGEELERLYRLNRTLTPHEAVRATELIEDAGGRSWVRQQAKDHTQQAIQCLHKTGLLPEVVTALSELANTLTGRPR